MVGSLSNTTGLVNSNYGYLPEGMVENGIAKVDKATAEKVQAGIQAKLDQLPDIGDDAFMQMVADLAPEDVNNPAKMQEALDALANAAALLAMADSAPAVFVGDISRLLGQLLIQQMNDERKNALNDRLAAREQAKADLMGQADKMDDAAEKMIQGAQTAMITGLVAASIQFLGAITSIAGAAKALKEMGPAAKATKSAMEAAEKAEQSLKVAVLSGNEALEKLSSAKLQVANLSSGAASKAFDKAGQWAQLFTGIGQAASAIGEGTRSYGTSADAKAQAEAKKDEAEGSRSAAMSQEAQQMADNKKQMEEALNDMVKQIINFLKELRETEVDAMRALTRV